MALMATTRFKLPDVLGGGEIVATEVWGGCAGGRPEYHIGAGDNGFTLLAPRGAPLESVPPPIPAEPEPGAYLIGDTLAVRFPDTDDFNLRWRWSDVDTADSWGICWRSLGGPDVTITPLVAALPKVELPWRGSDRYGDPVNVEVNRDEVILEVEEYGEVKQAALPPESAERVAAALLSAARAARSKP